MFKPKFQQLQIFSEDEISKEKDKKPNFIALIFQYEKKIKIFIVFIISLLVVYSMGVEKGKRTIQTEKKELTSLKTEEIKPPSPPKEEIQKIYPDLAHKAGIKQYIIQVATYKKDLYAKREVVNLKKKGFQSFTKKSGDFIIVYVGNFQSKDEALISLKKLRKYYSDCFIRKL